MTIDRRICASLLSAAAMLVSAPSPAIDITATQDTNTLVNALLGAGANGIIVTGVTLSGHQQVVDFGEPGMAPAPLLSSGVYTNPSGTYGIGPGIVLGTGNVQPVRFNGYEVFPGYGDASNTSVSASWAYGGTYPVVIDPQNPTPGEPATPEQDALLDPITGSYSHYDVTEILVSFNMQPGYNRVAFAVAFGSEEYPEFAGSNFVDGFGIYLNGVNIARANGLPVNIAHPSMTELTGTELDGVLAPGGIPLLNLSGPVNPAGNTLRFIITDTFDGVYDTVAYFSNLHGFVQPPDADSDGIADSSDNCTQASNPTQLDSDGDGYGNLCDADLNNSGLTTAADFNLLRSVLNRTSGSSALAAAADMNGSGLVTSADFNLMRARFNTAPGPSGLHP